MMAVPRLYDGYDQEQRAKSRRRVHSRGWDPVLTGVGFGFNTDALQSGLRVPYAPTAVTLGEISPTSIVQPYLFQLCSIGVGKGLWVTGMGLLSLIGCEQGFGGVPAAPPIFPNTIQQTSAGFHFPDCKPIRYGLRQARKPAIPWAGRNVLNTNSFGWRWVDDSGLVYETATFPAGNLNRLGTPDNYLTLTNYAAPAQPWVFPGRPVGGSLGSFDSLDFPWEQAQRKAFEPIWVDGSGYLVLYAWVCQTNPATSAKLIVPGSFPMPTTGMPELAFLGDWGTDATSNTGGAVQYSVGGWLEVEHSDGPRQWSRGGDLSTPKPGDGFDSGCAPKAGG